MPLAGMVPVGRIADAIHRYTLVARGPGGESLATGITRQPSRWRQASPVTMDHRSLLLKAGDFRFVVDADDGRETLLASPARRDEHLARAAQTAHATLVIGCVTQDCARQLPLDGGPPLPLPCRPRFLPWSEEASALVRAGRQEEFESRCPATVFDTVAAQPVPPGRHTLRASGGRWTHNGRAGLIPGGASLTLDCSPGQVIFAIIDVTARSFDFWGAHDVRWSMEPAVTMPTCFHERHLVLFRDSRWLVGPEIAAAALVSDPSVRETLDRIQPGIALATADPSGPPRTRLARHLNPYDRGQQSALRRLEGMTRRPTGC